MGDSPESKATFRDPKPAAERIVQLGERVLQGDILLPRFQRDFVWNYSQVIDLLDSIAKNYPIGSVLLWQSRQELAHERKIADLDVAPTKPDYPVNYLLDGQQRLSTICGALHWAPGNPRSVWNVAYDLKSKKFIHLTSSDEPALHIIPLRYLSKASTFFGRLPALPDSLQERARVLFDRFTDYQVAVVTLGDMSIEDVAPVFERINSTGTRLTIVDLMRAATWSTTFDLVESVDQIAISLQPKKFGGIDRKTLLRAIASTAGFGFSKNAIDELRSRTEEELRQDLADTGVAARKAADYLATEIGATGDRSLPYVNQFVVLCEIFRQLPSPTSTQFQAISQWFWRTTFGSYFGGWNTGQMTADRDAVTAFAAGLTNHIATSTTAPTASIWMKRNFRANSAISKLLALMLGRLRPVDLVTGQAIDVDKALTWGNDKDFHHFFPQAHVKRHSANSDANVVGNIILLTSASNLDILDKAPSLYLKSIESNIGRPELVRRLEASMVPETAYAAALRDDYETFLAERSDHLQREALRLANLDESGTELPTGDDDEDRDPTED